MMMMSEEEEEEDIYGSSPFPPTRRVLGQQKQQFHPQSKGLAASSPDTIASNSSDKENAFGRAAADRKGKERVVMRVSEQDGLGKRRRQTASEANPRPTKEARISLEADDRLRDSVEGDDDEESEHEARELVENDASDEKDYDPDQDPAICRQIKRDLREVIVDMDGIEINASNPMKTYDIIQRANKILPSIKQTAVATIDSRLMVKASTMSYRQACQLSLGNSVQGLDLDEFVSKCISFMKSNAEANAPSQTQRGSQSHKKQRRQTNESVDEEEDGENGDHLNWALLGQMACQRYNLRPAVPGFLLGPLSLEKKARKQVQRVARLKPSQYTQTQPKILDREDRDHDEKKTLTYLTKMIYQKLIESRKERLDKVEAIKRRNADMSLPQAKRLMESNGLLFPNAGINLWQFVVNPKSFGQTVENIFYLSFLIRDGKARIEPDEDGQLGLFPEEPKREGGRTGKDSARYQGIISMDMAEWKELIDLYNIKESIIQHRNEEVELAVRTWV